MFKFFINKKRVYIFLIVLLLLNLIWFNFFNHTSEFLPKTLLIQNQLWGDVNKEMFTEINQPTFNSPNSIKYLNDSDKLLLFKNQNKSYAIPLPVISLHHIINANFDGKPLSVTYCLLSDTSVVFERDRDQYLGINGQLYYGNLIMYDKANDDTYLQLNGQQLYGQKQLKVSTIPKKVTWKSIKSDPNLLVMDIPSKKLKWDDYQKFYQSRSDAKVGIMSVESKKELDERIPATSTGIGTLVFGKPVFFRIDNPNSIIKKLFFGVDVYWYVWSAFYPKAVIF